MIHQPHCGSATKEFMVLAHRRERRETQRRLHALGLFSALSAVSAVRSPLVLSRKAKSAPNAVRNAAPMLQSEDHGTLRLGSFGFDGSPYVSGLSVSK